MRRLAAITVIMSPLLDNNFHKTTLPAEMIPVVTRF